MGWSRTVSSATRLRKSAAAGIAGMLLAAFLTGCGASDAGEITAGEGASEGPDAGTDASADSQSLSFGVLRAPTGALGVVAGDQGWFQDAGVDPEFISFAEGGGPKMVQAMAGGEPELALFNLATAVLARGQGTSDFMIVGVAVDPFEALPLISTSEIGSVADLKGKKVSSPPSGGLYYELARILDKHGMTFDDIDFKPLPVGEAQAAFLTGELDAVVSSANGAALIQGQMPDAKVLFSKAKFTSGEGSTEPFVSPDVFVATREAIENKPEAIRAFLSTYNGEAVEYMTSESTREDAISAVNAYMESVGASSDALETTGTIVDAFDWYSLDESRELLASDEFADAIQSQAEFWVDQGVFDEAPAVEDVLTTQFVEEQ